LTLAAAGGAKQSRCRGEIARTGCCCRTQALTKPPTSHARAGSNAGLGRHIATHLVIAKGAHLRAVDGHSALTAPPHPCSAAATGAADLLAGGAIREDCKRTLLWLAAEQPPASLVDQRAPSCSPPKPVGLLHPRRSSHLPARHEAARLGVLQQRAVDPLARLLHPSAGVRADDRFGRRLVIRRTIAMATIQHSDGAGFS
jgi:hypothetical protein